jgi:hemerythrin HHE cation binding domain-containing protein
MLVEEFTETFRDEHRRMRDTLLGLMDAFQTNDGESIRKGIEEITAQAEPHFLYEREALYPALVDFYGPEYVDKLLAEHDLAVEATRRLSELAEAEEMDEEASRYGVQLIRQLLPHVIERDGLSVMVEVFAPETVDKIRKAQEKSRKVATTRAGSAERPKKRRAAARKPGTATRRTLEANSAKPIGKPKARRKARARRQA